MVAVISRVEKITSQPGSGWLNLDKPVGLSSAQLLTKVKRLLSIKKLGHAGTLDPFASGVLPVAVGEATKLMPYIVDQEKEYRFTVSWGINTDTDDITGQIISQHQFMPSQQAIEQVVQHFVGDIQQVPPIYSALKINGQRSYSLARARQPIESLKSRLVRVFKLEVLSHTEGETSFFLCCGKGTYVRSLARDMGRNLGTGGCVKSLRRLRVGIFKDIESISLETLKNIGHIVSSSGAGVDFLRPLHTGLDDIPVVCITGKEYQDLRCGRPVLLTAERYNHNVSGFRDGFVPTLQARVQDRLVAITSFVQGYLKSIRVLNINFEERNKIDVDQSGT